MLGDSNSNSNAEIKQSIEIPDYFSCKNCRGWNWDTVCRQLRQENICAKQMLSYAIQSGAVQIHLQLANPK